MSTMERVILLTNSSLPGRLIAKRVSKKVNLVGIIVECKTGKPIPQRSHKSGVKERMRHTVGEQHYSQAIFVYSIILSILRRDRKICLEQKVERIERKYKRNADTAFRSFAGADADSWPIEVPRCEVVSINNKQSSEWCKRYSPDLVLVFGTTILRAPIIRIPKLGALNVHTSLLPDYRGTHSEFWQVLDGNLDRAGVSIHFIDEGVDTGDIVLQEGVEMGCDIDPFLLRVKNLMIAVRILPDAARLVLNGTAHRTRQGIASTPTFRSKDMILEKRMELLKKLGYRF